MRAMTPRKAPLHLIRDFKTQTVVPVSKMVQGAYSHLGDNGDLFQELRQHNEKRGIYFVVNPGGDADLEITRYSATFSEMDPPKGADIDQFLAEQLAAGSPLPPSIELVTYKSVHRHWLIKGDCDREWFLLLQQGQIAHYHSDASIMNESRVMRLPRFNHVRVDSVNNCLAYKPIQSITFIPERKYTVDDLREAFPVGPEGLKKVFEKLTRPDYNEAGIEPSEALRKEIEAIRKQPRSTSGKASTSGTHEKRTTLKEILERERAGEQLKRIRIPPADYAGKGIDPRDADLIEGTIERMCLLMANAEQGKKDNTLLDVAKILHGLVRGGLADDDRITGLLREAVILGAEGNPQFDLSHAERTMRNAFKYAEATTLEDLRQRDRESGDDQNKSAPHAAQQDPWGRPASFYEFDLPSFPTEAFPAWLRSYVEGLAMATQTPVDLTAMLALTALAAAVARNVRVKARRGWMEPLNLYAAAALLPGNRKSAVIDEVTRPLREYEGELLEGSADEIAEARNDYKILEARLEKAQKDCAKLEGEELERRRQDARKLARDLAAFIMPTEPQLICDDVTAEALATLLSEQGGRMALFSAEGGIFDVMAGRYSNGAANFDVYLKAHPGDTLRVNRRNRAEHVKAPALTMGLALQPEVITGLASKPGFRGRGLVGRLLYAIPPSNLGRRKIRAKPLTDEARNTYTAKLKDLARIQPVRPDGEPESARLIYFSGDADDYLAAFEEELEPMLAEDAELGHMSDWAGKLSGAAVRIAGILHLAENVHRVANSWPAEISAETFKRAAKIGRYLIPHAQAAYAEMGADPLVEDAKHVLRWIQKTQLEAFSKRDVHQSNRGRFKKVTDIEPALELLEAHEYIRTGVADKKDGKRGRKASQIFEVNPYCFNAAQKVISVSSSEYSEYSEYKPEKEVSVKLSEQSDPELPDEGKLPDYSEYSELLLETVEADDLEIEQAKVSFMITKDQRQQLYDLGYSSAEVDAMKPYECHEILSAEAHYLDDVETVAAYEGGEW